MPDNNPTSAKHNFWEFKKYQEHEWFRFLIWLLVILAVAYLVSHVIVNSTDDDAAYEYNKLSKEQLQQINRIYFDSENRLESGRTIAAPSPNDTSTGDGVNQRQRNDSATRAAQAARYAMDTAIIHYKSRRVVEFLSNQFNYKIEPVQLESIRHYLHSALPLDALGFLSNLRLKVKSYFWLVGPQVYFEIIFWAWFGVVASLLFNMGVIGRNRTTDPNNSQSVFDSSEIPYQFAKFWYAPLCTLAIVLGYNFFSSENIADISSSKGIIVFAFIGGFYSARLIAFLDRLKDLLLPQSNTSELPNQTPTAVVKVTNTTVELKLEDSELTPEIQNEIAEMGLGAAEVKFENDVNGEIITAEKAGEDQSATYRVPEMKAGKYTVKVNWSKPVGDAQIPVNLKGEEKVQIVNSDTVIPVGLKKAEDEG